MDTLNGLFGWREISEEKEVRKATEGRRQTITCMFIGGAREAHTLPHWWKMMNRFKGAFIMLLSVTVGLTSQAWADTINGTFTGTVYHATGSEQGIDLSTLLGETVTGTFSYDSASLLPGYSDPPYVQQFNGTITTFTAVGGLSFSQTLTGYVELNNQPNFVYFGSGISGDIQVLIAGSPSAILYTDMHDPASVDFSLTDGALRFGSAGETDFAGGGQLAFNLTSVTATASVGAINVSIDIKPGSFSNSINPWSKAKIPVAILTTDTFDATTVDPTAVLFGATGTEATLAHSVLEDVDGDGDTDMILHFNTQSTGIVCGGTSASLTGEIFSGQAIQGSDSINTVGCK